MEAFCGFPKLTFYFEFLYDFTVKKSLESNKKLFFAHFLGVTNSLFEINPDKKSKLYQVV